MHKWTLVVFMIREDKGGLQSRHDCMLWWLGEGCCTYKPVQGLRLIKILNLDIFVDLRPFTGLYVQQPSLHTLLYACIYKHMQQLKHHAIKHRELQTVSASSTDCFELLGSRQCSVHLLTIWPTQTPLLHTHWHCTNYSVLFNHDYNQNTF